VANATKRAGELLSLLVTDSGLGGLAVVADLERRARASGRYRALDLLFASALPETGCGYNKMASRAAKLEVFDAALAGMLGLARADALVVACNTLSVLIPESRTLASVRLPVHGIVEVGVEAVAERLSADARSAVAIFATETTIDAGAHRDALQARGIDPERIVTVPCPGLASRIELEGASAGVAAEIGRFARAAVGACEGRPDRLVAALCCTHYGYCAAEFAAALLRAGAGAVEVVDPNRRLADRFFPPGESEPPGAGAVSLRVVSRALPLPEEIASIAALLEPLSPPTAAALRAYELRRDLFSPTV